MASELINQYHKIIGDLKAKKYGPIYILQGEESYFIDAVCDYIEANVLTESEKSFNQIVFYAKDAEPNVVVEAAKRFPMMAEKQLIIVKEAQGYKNLDGFNAYFEKPVPSTILVLCLKGKKIDKRTVLHKTASKHIILESNKLQEKDLIPWIKSHVQNIGYNISDKSVQLISDSLGSDLAKIANELDKLFLNKNDGNKEITDTDIEANIGISKEFNAFELLNAIAAKNSHRAFKIGHHLSKAKDFSIIPFVALLSGMFSKGYIIKKTNTTDKNTIVKAFGIGYYQADDYVNLVKNYTLSEIEKALSICSAYDLKSKGINTVSISNQEMLKEILVRIF